MPTQSTLTEKSCSKCKELKSLDAFYTSKASKDGREARCKDCRNTYFAIRRKDNPNYIKEWNIKNPNYKANHYKTNRDKYLEYSAKKYKENPEYFTQWNLNNKDKNRSKDKKWRDNNPDKVRDKWVRRRASKLNRTVSWSSIDKIKEIYSECDEVNLAAKTAGCASSFVVDHIIPLRGKLVSGLHVETNLQIITADENYSKGNKFIPGYHS